MYRTDSNAVHATSTPSAADRRLTAAARSARYRSRDFGTGYGNSSGYAAARRYTPVGQPAARFRLG